MNIQDIKTELRIVLNFINSWEKLPLKYRDHKLQWEYKKARECHIIPDLLLIYEIDWWELILLLLRLWTHSEIF